MQTDYLHSRLTPRFTVIADVSGMFAFAPSMTYHMVQLRLTAQLN